MATRDRLFLLHSSFQDPSYPGELFYCADCALVEGLLATFPVLKENLEIHHVDYPRPRKTVVDVVGEENQWLPMLVLAEGESSPHQTGVLQGHAFVTDKASLLRVLSERHGIPLPHP